MTQINPFKLLVIKLKTSFRFRFVLEMIVGLALLSWVIFLAYAPVNPVPKNILEGVNFKVYYPNPRALPKGYSLNISSFQIPQNGVLLFSVNYGTNQTIIFSEEIRPASNVISQFTAAYLPLHTNLTTPLGQAIIGAYNNGQLKSVISLPINNGPWVIATASANIDQPTFEKVVEALTKG